MVSVAFQGERGAFSEEAAILYFKDRLELKPCYSFSEVFERVLTGDVDYGIVPVENSYAGSIVDTFDLLLQYDVNIVGEKVLRIRHNLIVNVNVKIDDVEVVYAHPQATAQCDIFLRKINKKIVPFYDTAGSVKHVKENNLRNAAAIGSKLAAEIYGMSILAESIESNPDNYTRFYVISLAPAKKGVKNKTTIVFSTRNIPGSLYHCLKPFADSGINLTKIESRPNRKKPWEYVFYLEFEGLKDEVKSLKALSELKKKASLLKILGSYPADPEPQNR